MADVAVCSFRGWKFCISFCHFWDSIQHFGQKFVFEIWFLVGVISSGSVAEDKAEASLKEDGEASLFEGEAKQKILTKAQYDKALEVLKGKLKEITEKAEKAEKEKEKEKAESPQTEKVEAETKTE